MTYRAILGLVLLNSCVAVVGFCLLYGLRGWRGWNDLLRLAGVSYLLGIAALFVTFTLVLVIGIPLGALTMLSSAVALALSGVIAGRVGPIGGTPTIVAHPGWQLTILGSLALAIIVVYLEAIFRVGRLEWLWEWDSWRVWTRVAKALYFSGSFDPNLAGIFSAYPPGVPALQAAAFHAMGSADVVTVHLQPWFLLVGFVAALSGLLAPHVRPSILLPLLLLLVLAPSIRERAVWMLSDLTMDYLLAIAVLLVVFWLEDRRRWQLITATVLLAGVLMTKREALLLVACVLFAAFVASWPDRRWAWPRLLASLAACVLLTMPWRLWIVVHDLPSDGPQAGYVGFLTHLDRAWPSLRLIVETFIDYDLWLLGPWVAVAGILLAFLVCAWRTAVFAAVFLCSSLVAATWVIWANPTYEFTRALGTSSVVRLVGATVIVIGALSPLLLERAFAASGLEGWLARITRPRWRRGSPRRGLWIVPIAAAILYPTWVAVGDSPFRGPQHPRPAGGEFMDGFSGYVARSGVLPFPSPADCAANPVRGARVRLVLGYETSYPSALAVLERARRGGFAGASVYPDGCGRLRVAVDDVGDHEARTMVARARGAGLSPALEAHSYRLRTTTDVGAASGVLRARSIPKGSCYESILRPARFDGTVWRLARMDGGEQLGWAISDAGWIPPQDFALFMRGAEVLPATEVSEMTPATFPKCGGRS